tara:strand:- start:117 stop:368 length:252 start_codon:yes stop_codon:yes gene_type:complete
MIDIDKNLELFYEREENKEDTYIGAISKHECVVDGWFVIELLEEVKRLRKALKDAEDVIQYALEMSSDDDSTRVFEDYLEVIE